MLQSMGSQRVDMEDGGGIGQGDHLLPTNSSKNHLNAEQLPQNNF